MQKIVVDMIRIWEYRSIIILTGAGISEPASIPVFRGANGLWEDKETKCSNNNCNYPLTIDLDGVYETAPICPVCNERLRPNIVLFGESLDLNGYLVKRALRDCDLFISIGTSGTVSPASNFVRGAKYSGARTVCMNLTQMSPSNPYFNEEILGYADDIVCEKLVY